MEVTVQARVALGNLPKRYSPDLNRDFPFGLCLELVQARSASHSNKLRPPPWLGRGEILVYFRP